MKQNLVVIVALWASIVLVGCDFLSGPPTGPVATSLIETVYVIDAEGTSCLSCPDGVIPAEVEEVLAAANPIFSRRWIQSGFDYRDEDFNRSMKSIDAASEYFDFDMGMMGGIFYQADGYRIHYESIPCWYWDCYKPRLCRIDDGGRQRWRRRVPHAYAPVRPFVVGDYILYIGGTAEGYMLVFVDVNTGKVVGHYLPEDDEFTDSVLLVDPAFYRDGYVYLRGHTKSVFATPGRPDTAVDTPSKIYVVKVNF
jgi:hypothetical protein